MTGKTWLNQKRQRKNLCLFVRMCVNMHLYMADRETPEDVRRWFQSAIQDLWPVATGSLSLRKSPCIRKRCQLCESGQGHSSYALYGRKGNRRFSIYVPEELTGDLEKAIRNGRNLQKIVAEAGRRYTLARKRERSLRNAK
jgi:hypothetical protein